jgi:hypothetical protein
MMLKDEVVKSLKTLNKVVDALETAGFVSLAYEALGSFERLSDQIRRLEGKDVDKVWMDALEHASETGQEPHRVFLGMLGEG